MHSGPMDELIKLHIQERHREAARYRLGRPPQLVPSAKVAEDTVVGKPIQSRAGSVRPCVES
ncbi:MAG: hypothetical protein ACRDJT_08005 [Actinomycetota bacterium]